jgi:hypothetical protein
MTAKIDITSEVRVMQRALRSVVAKAKAAGVADPIIYFEAEGCMFVIDNDHPAWKSDTIRQNAAEAQKAIVASGRIGVKYDVGAW